MTNFKEIKNLEELSELKVGEVVKIGQIFEDYGIIPALCDNNDSTRISLLIFDKKSKRIVEYPSLSIGEHEDEGIEGIYPNGSLRMNFFRNSRETFEESKKGYFERKIKLEKAGLF